MAIEILESNATPIAGRLYRLYERSDADVSIVNDPYKVEQRTDESNRTVLDERRVQEGPFLIRGVFQRADVKNANGRVYPKSIWEAHTAKDSHLMRKIAERSCVGQIEHPKDGVGSLDQTAICVTSLRLEPDGTVIGEAEVLETPQGRIVRDLLRANVRVGISSRGTGSVTANGIVEEKSYRCDTWDIVGSPSTPGAFPRMVENVTNNQHVVTESHNGQLQWRILDERTDIRRQPVGVLNMSKLNEYRALETRVRPILTAPLSESNTAHLQATDTALMEASVEVNALVESDSSLRDAADLIREQIAERRNAIAALIEKGCCGDDEGEDEEEDEEEEDDGGDEEDVEEAELSTPKYDEALACLREARDTIIALREANASLTERAEIAESAIDGLAEQCASHEVTIAEMIASNSAMTAILAEMTAVPTTDTLAISEAIDALCEGNSRNETLRPLFEKCNTLDELDAVVSALKSNGGLNEDTKKPASTSVLESSRSALTGTRKSSPGLPTVGESYDSAKSNGALNERTTRRVSETTSKGRGDAVSRLTSLTESLIRKQ